MQNPINRIALLGLVEWAKSTGQVAVAAAVKEVLIRSSEEVMYLLSCLPPEILEEALRRARERKERHSEPS